MKSASYGEGVYIGSSKSNLVGDASDYNEVVGNLLENCAAECIDIKEYSCCGTIDGNTMNGDAIAGKNSADSWIDVKGNNYLIKNNVGVHTSGVGALLDGFQTHELADGWGNYNRFENNTLAVNGKGYGVNIYAKSVGNIVTCNNKVVGAKLGLTNIQCGTAPPPKSGGLVVNGTADDDNNNNNDVETGEDPDEPERGTGDDGDGDDDTTIDDTSSESHLLLSSSSLSALLAFAWVIATLTL
jgi:hypothetical protein